LRRRGFALHEGFEPKTLEGLRGILGAWSLELGARWMHGEFIHGATAILFCSGAFAWRRAHLRRRGALVFLHMLTRRGALVRLRRDLMHEEARERAQAFMVRDIHFQPQFIYCDQFC
jgi:hypothetical protein